MPDPIKQFDEWYGSPDGKERWIGQSESVYGFLARAFLAGYASRDREPREPARPAPSFDIRTADKVAFLAAPPVPRQDGPVPVPRPYPGHPGYGEGAQDASTRLPERAIDDTNPGVSHTGTVWAPTREFTESFDRLD